MIATVVGGSGDEGIAVAAQLLHDFNVEYDEPAPPPDKLAIRLEELIAGDNVAVGVAVLRLQPSLWSRAAEAYLAELYVMPDQRGKGAAES